MPRPMRVLCLHGLTENASVMERKLSSMIQHLQPSNNFQFTFISAPYVLPAVESAPIAHGMSLNLSHNRSTEEQHQEFNKACSATSYLLAARGYVEAEKKRHQSDNVPDVADLIPKYTAILDSIDEKVRKKAEEHIYSNDSSSKRWWTLPSQAGKLSPYIGQEIGLSHISKVMREQGPFDGVVGFSTGAMMAGFCQSLLQGCITPSTAPSFQPPQDQGPFQFALYIAPWMTPAGPYSRYFDGLHSNLDKHTPALCFEGIRDRHCVKGSCRQFADCVNVERYEYHNGGHSLPSWEDYPAFMADWLSLAAKEVRGEMSKEEAKKARLQLKSPYQDVKMRQNYARL